MSAAVKTTVKNLNDLLQDSAKIPAPWAGRCVVNDDNLTYVVWNETSREAIVVDPMQEDWNTLLQLTDKELKGYRFLTVIDTHTHADHISCAARLAAHLKAPLIMHFTSPSRRVDLRVNRDCALPTAAGPLQFLHTPGHTPDGIVPIWGPFVFGGDTFMYGDTGRNDLPGGEPETHWESLQKIKAAVQPDQILLPGHDGKGGRASSWKTQLEINPSLTQDRETFVREAGSYVGPAPKNMKESLYENFK